MNYRTQFERQELIKEKCGIIIVTCGNCGGVLLAKNDDYTGDEDYSCKIGHKCPCGFCSDVCDFPDLFQDDFPEEDYTLNRTPWDSQLSNSDGDKQNEKMGH